MHWASDDRRVVEYEVDSIARSAPRLSVLTAKRALQIATSRNASPPVTLKASPHLAASCLSEFVVTSAPQCGPEEAIWWSCSLRVLLSVHALRSSSLFGLMRRS